MNTNGAPGRAPSAENVSAASECSDDAAQTKTQGTRRPTLAEPVVCAQFWRNRRGEAVIVQLREFNGRVLIDARVSFTNKEGKLQPTGKGLALSIRRLPDLADAINKALVKAKALELIPDEGASDE
jgi:hypothetical protein